MRSTTGGRSTPALICRTASSTRTFCIWISKAWRSTRAAGARSGCGGRKRWSARSKNCAPQNSWSTSAWRRSSCVSCGCSYVAIPARMQEERRRTARSSTPFASARAICCAASRSIARLTGHLHKCRPEHLAVDGMAGGVAESRFRGDAGIRARTSDAKSCFSSGSSGRSTGNLPRRSSTRASASSRSACITIWRWRPTVSAQICGRTGRSSLAAAAWARRPTTSRRRGRIGAFRRPTRESIARMAIGYSPNPSARIAGTAARCASIT